MPKTTLENTVNITETHESVIETLDFSTALSLLKIGKYLRRLDWNDPTGVVRLEKFGFTNPIFTFVNREKDMRMPWVPSSNDLISEDWVIVEPAMEECSNQYGNAQTNQAAQPKQSRQVNVISKVKR